MAYEIKNGRRVETANDPHGLNKVRHNSPKNNQDIPNPYDSARFTSIGCEVIDIIQSDKDGRVVAHHPVAITREIRADVIAQYNNRELGGQHYHSGVSRNVYQIDHDLAYAAINNAQNLGYNVDSFACHPLVVRAMHCNTPESHTLQSVREAMEYGGIICGGLGIPPAAQAAVAFNRIVDWRESQGLATSEELGIRNEIRQALFKSGEAAHDILVQAQERLQNASLGVGGGGIEVNQPESKASQLLSALTQMAQEEGKNLDPTYKAVGRLMTVCAAHPDLQESMAAPLLRSFNNSLESGSTGLLKTQLKIQLDSHASEIEAAGLSGDLDNVSKYAHQVGGRPR
ncbi:MAG: hypothetical protein J0L97_08525 [Alphaproteobacteria bacterium]|nr:hypothetical protein [Alphaproteobacteria bacterium]